MQFLCTFDFPYPTKAAVTDNLEFASSVVVFAGVAAVTRVPSACFLLVASWLAGWLAAVHVDAAAAEKTILLLLHFLLR